MSQLSLSLLRLGFLALLWALVLSAIAVLRADIYGTRVLTRGRGLSRKSKPRKVVSPERAGTGVKASRARKSTHLSVVEGPLQGTSIPLGPAPVTIGRAPRSTLVLEDDYCSSQHARIYDENGTWMIEDLGSTNGTFLDDAKLAAPTELKRGSVIRLGATSIELAD